MAISREDILVTNLRECLSAYQRCVLLATSIATTFCLFSLQLWRAPAGRIALLYADVSLSVAWLGALAVVFVLGFYVAFLVRRLRELVARLATTELPVNDLLLTPSVATIESQGARVGAALVPAGLLVIGFVVEIIRERRDPGDHAPILGLAATSLALVVPYLFAAAGLRERLGSPSR